MSANYRSHQSEPNYFIELVIALLLVTGIFLIRAEIDLLNTLRQGLLSLGSGIQSIKKLIHHFIMMAFVESEGSDIVGVLTMILALYLTTLRIRKKLLSHQLGFSQCPECGERSHRIHRTKFQQALTRFLCLDSGYYHCGKCNNYSLQFRSKPPEIMSH